MSQVRGAGGRTQLAPGTDLSQHCERGGEEGLREVEHGLARDGDGEVGGDEVALPLARHHADHAAPLAGLGVAPAVLSVVRQNDLSDDSSIFPLQTVTEFGCPPYQLFQKPDSSPSAMGWGVGKIC